MPTSLTATKIKDTYGQLLHVDGGVTSTPKIVYDGDGTATGLSISTTGISGNLTGNVTGDVSGNAGTVTNGVYTTGDQTIGGTKTLSSNPVLSAGTANGVAYLNGSKVLTSGSALTFDGTNLGVGDSPSTYNGKLVVKASNQAVIGYFGGTTYAARLGANASYATVEGVDAATGVSSYQPLQIGGSLLKFDVGGSEQMRLTSTGLGIGTSSPSAKLHLAAAGDVGGKAVNSATTGSATWNVTNNSGSLAQLMLYGSAQGAYGAIGSGEASLYSTVSTTLMADSASGVLKFATGGNVEKMRLDSSGNLGLGVTPSAWSGFRAFDVGAYAALASPGSTTDLLNNAYNNGSWIYKNTNYATLLRQENGAFKFFTAPSGTAGNAISFTQAMTLDASGNLGIGTSSPARKLHVSGGSAQIDYDYASSGTSFRILNDATPSNGVTLNAEFYGSGSYGPMKFWTGNAERMRIDSSGNVLVGTTTLNAAGGVSITPGYILFNTAATSNTPVYFRYNGTTVGSINTTTTATTYATSSDYRLKENIQPMQGALDVVAQLNPVTYNWKADGSDGQGFIAHELQAVVPDCVTGEKDAVDVEGKPVYQGIDTSFLVATLTKAIQELKQEVDQLKSQLENK